MLIDAPIETGFLLSSAEKTAANQAFYRMSTEFDIILFLYTISTPIANYETPNSNNEISIVNFENSISNN